MADLGDQRGACVFLFNPWWRFSIVLKNMVANECSSGQAHKKGIEWHEYNTKTPGAGIRGKPVLVGCPMANLR